MWTQTINLKIELYPSYILRRKAKPVDKITPQERDILNQMTKIMYEQKGLGLAANQVGIDKAMLVADPGDCLYKLINPKIIKRGGEVIMEEGCLSIPGICVNVKRAAEITVQAQDENGKPVAINAQGLFSIILQHEIDHLKGRLIIDHASLFERLKIRKTIKELRRRNERVFESKEKSCHL